MPRANRRVVLVEYPEGPVTSKTFRIEDASVAEPAAGQVLLRTLYLSLDPYMRGRITGGPSYAATVSPGETMLGETVSLVEQSRHSAFPEGALVLANSGWQLHELSNGEDLTRLDDSFIKPSYALGVLGMPGLTAYYGLFEIGDPKPGETVVVAAATGAVGSVVGQLARLRGARAVGIAGGPDKCAYAVKELGFDACVDHHEPRLGARLAAACPRGIDVYFENVGGRVFAAAAPLLNPFARVPLCGFISRYDRGGDYTNTAPDKSERLLAGILFRRLRLQGFLISDHADRRDEFLAYMKPLVRDGRVKTREDVVIGLENAPLALAGLLTGKNFGKLLIQMSEA